MPAVRRPADLDPAVRLARHPKEPSQAHRCFMLWAMQDEERRSLRRATNAVGRTEGSGRNWRMRYKWDERISLEGASTQARAVQLYRETYYPAQQMREIAMVEPNMRVAFLVASPPPSVSTGVGDAQRTEQTRAEEAPPRKQDSPEALARLSLERGLSIVDALLGDFGRKLTADLEAQAKAAREKRPHKSAIHVGVRDVPMLLKVRRDLSEYIGETAPAGAVPAALEPSARLVEARRKGESELAAMREDAEEILVVLRALENSDAVARETPKPAAAPLRVVAADEDPDAFLTGEAG